MTRPTSVDDVEVIEHHTPFSGYFRLDRYRLRHRLFDGGWSEPMVREVLERGHAVAVIPYDPVRDELVLIEQFRPGAFSAARSSDIPDGISPWLLEVVAGIIDDDERPEAVARREAVEEAGVEIGDMVFATRILASPGCSSETVTVYCGRVDASQAGGIHGLDHEHEDIRVLTVTADEAFRWLDEDRFVNATAAIALYWFRANHAR
ncbi:MAG: NUDIX domain-containing protein, partial [Rhodospirillales bacterium]|nr:NUDIX domain-containing protein [Rhodospirillales bacterium]